MILLPILPLSHLASSLCELFHLSKRRRPSVPGSPRPVSRTTLSGISANCAKSAREGPCDRVAGTASMSFGSFDEYVCMSEWGLKKYSTCLHVAFSTHGMST